MSYFINYEKILERIEKKNQAKSKKHIFDPNGEVYMMDGGRLRIYTPGTFYLETMKFDTSSCN